MRRWILRIASLMITCSLGLTATFLRPRFTYKVIPYCAVANDEEAYYDKYVRVKARVFLGDHFIGISEDCDPVEALAAHVETTPTTAFSGATFVDGSLEGIDLSTTKTADAIVEGRFEYASPGCWGPKFRIVATRVELISPVVNWVPPTESNGLRTKH